MVPMSLRLAAAVGAVDETSTADERTRGAFGALMFRGFFGGLGC